MWDRSFSIVEEKMVEILSIEGDGLTLGEITKLILKQYPNV